MDLLTLLRIIFLLCLGVHLLAPNRVCQYGAGLSAILLAAFILARY